MKKLFTMLLLLIVSSISFAQEPMDGSSVIETEIYLPTNIDGKIQVILPFFKKTTKEATIVKLTYYEKQQLMKIQFEVDNQIHSIFLNWTRVGAQGFCDEAQEWHIKCPKETERWIVSQIQDLLSKKVETY